MSTARFMLIAFAAALLCAGTQLSFANEWGIFWLEGFPVGLITNGLLYMAVFFHELGHTLTAWFYGYPTLPSFDFQNGGGMAYYFDRPLPLVFMIEAALIGGIIYYWQETWLRVILMIALTFHLATAFFPIHEVFISYMGHGAELCIAAFLLYRAWMDLAPRGVVERFLNGWIGFFFILNNMILSWGLMRSARMRHLYDTQKDSHGFGDFSKIQHILNLPDIGYVGGFNLLMATMALIAPLLLYLIYNPGRETSRSARGG